MSLPITGDPAADELLETNGTALLIGMPVADLRRGVEGIMVRRWDTALVAASRGRSMTRSPIR